MAELTYRIDLPGEPPAVTVDGDAVTMSREAAPCENTGLWAAEQLTFDWPGNPGVDAIAEDFDSVWTERENEAMAESTASGEGDGSDALLTEMYEQMLAMQEAQEATDAALCDLYEAMGGEQ